MPKKENHRKKRDKKLKLPDEMTHSDYRKWRDKSITSLSRNFKENKIGLESYPVKRKYGVVITEREIKPGMILTSREFIGVPPRKFKTLIEKEDDKLLKKAFSLERPKYYPSEIFLIIKKAKPEIDKLWQHVWKTYKNSQENENEDRTDLEILKDASLNWVKKNKPLMLKKKYFENKIEHHTDDQDPYPDNDQYLEERGIKRNFVGKLLQKIISDRYPDVFPPDVFSDPKKKTPTHFGLKNFYELYSQF